MYQLRDYQEKAKQELYQKIREGKRKIIIWVPTGGGKGLMMSDLVKDIDSVAKSTMTVMRRRDVVLQTQKNYTKYHQHKTSVIMGNSKGFVRDCPHQICSIDTIRTRMLMDNYQHLAKSRLFQVDECHDTNSPTYQSMFKWIGENNPDPIFVGFTATPFTVGGKPLSFWEDIVQPIKSEDMRDLGWLVPAFHYGPEAKINTVGLKVIQGDFKEKDLFTRASESTLVGDIVATWKRLGQNRPTIMFCVNKEHSMLMTAAFNMEGVPAIHVDESSTSSEREAAIQGLRTGKYKIMLNIETMTTGVDAPWVSCIIWGRPTWSEVLYCQGNGRGLRPYKICADCGFEYGAEKQCLKCKSSLVSFEKRDCIILDHAANTERHGRAFDPRSAKLTSMMTKEQLKNFKGKGARTVQSPVVLCEKCYVYTAPGTPCPRCLVIKKSTELPKQEKGELTLIDDEMARKLRLNQILSQYEFFRRKAEIQGWGEGKVWFVLHRSVGDVMFQFEKELGFPTWIKNKIWENQQRKVYEENKNE